MARGWRARCLREDRENVGRALCQRGDLGRYIAFHGGGGIGIIGRLRRGSAAPPPALGQTAAPRRRRSASTALGGDDETEKNK